ncbi:hypothetical protein A0H81_12152 [Grifola frondosa]|uniref:Uncharacterized protein n=1 Tax=Grifola frondosa TaxID=5627 RepID=A0A1C7LUU5_GRIFR|nr:hypothetical protein A0H81_12152 [Grifola frondosa]
MFTAAPTRPLPPPSDVKCYNSHPANATYEAIFPIRNGLLSFEVNNVLEHKARVPHFISEYRNGLFASRDGTFHALCL